MCINTGYSANEIFLFILISLCLLINCFVVKILFIKSKQYVGFSYQLVTVISDMLKNGFYLLWILNGFPKLTDKCSSILINNGDLVNMVLSTLPLSILGAFDSFQFLNSIIITYDRILALSKPLKYSEKKRKEVILATMIVGFFFCMVINCYRFIGNVSPAPENATGIIVTDTNKVAYFVSISRVVFTACQLIIFVGLFPFLIRQYRKFLHGPQQPVNILRREKLLTWLTIFTSLVIFLCNFLSLGIQCALIWVAQGPDLFYVIFILRMSQGYLNVVLDLVTCLGYYIISSEFRKAFKNMLICRKAQIIPIYHSLRLSDVSPTISVLHLFRFYDHVRASAWLGEHSEKSNNREHKKRIKVEKGEQSNNHDSRKIEMVEESNWSENVKKSKNRHSWRTEAVGESKDNGPDIASQSGKSRPILEKSSRKSLDESVTSHENRKKYRLDLKLKTIATAEKEKNRPVVSRLKTNIEQACNSDRLVYFSCDVVTDDSAPIQVNQVDFDILFELQPYITHAFALNSVPTTKIAVEKADRKVDDATATDITFIANDINDVARETLDDTMLNTAKALWSPLRSFVTFTGVGYSLHEWYSEITFFSAGFICIKVEDQRIGQSLMWYRDHKGLTKDTPLTLFAQNQTDVVRHNSTATACFCPKKIVSKFGSTNAYRHIIHSVEKKTKLNQEEQDTVK
uniref:G-protein coupled receptors family 1 profile domain-containing protein n=1 Tax=Romanomermis culicivorax TaxID=13658 RepID=A0A915I9W0_ROMCU